MQEELPLKNIVQTKRQMSALKRDLLAEFKTYALKKRLVLPLWLLEGLLLSLAAKEPWFEYIAYARMGKIIACPNSIHVKTLIPFFLVWHELIFQMCNANNSEIKIQLNKYISGTEKVINTIAQEIQTIFSSPLKLLHIKPTKTQKMFSLSKAGNFNFIRYAHLEKDNDGLWLKLNLAHSFNEIFNPPELKNINNTSNNYVISISSVVMQSMSSRVTLKKILNYLFFECAKQESYGKDTNINYFPINCKKINPFHTSFLSSVPFFYDHGILGWNSVAPAQKISEIKNMYANTTPKHIICASQFSDQLKDAYYFEQAINAKIMQFSELPVAISSMVSEPPKEEQGQLSSLNDSQNLTEQEFISLVSEFYESLKPMQRRAFEKDRKQMTDTQFKAYMSAVLKCSKIKGN